MSTGAKPKLSANSRKVAFAAASSPGVEQDLAPGRVARVGRNVLGVQRVERLDHTGARREGGDPLAPGLITEVGHLDWVRSRELVGGVDQDASVPRWQVSHGGRDVRPHHREKHHVSLRGLRDRPRRGQRAQVGDDLVQRGRTAAVAQHHAVTGRYQMTGEGLGNGAGANGSKVHEPRISPAF
jgi:hypothetical protein